MVIKKYANGSWVSASYRKYGTETDAITTLPATVIGDSTPISSYIIKGNMEQTGTPTPENPIMPSGCGERTENLFDISKVDNGSAVTHSGDTISVLNAGLWYDLLCFTTDAGTSLDVTKGIFLAAGTYTIKIGQVVRTSGTGGVNGIVVFSEDGTSIEQLVTTYSIDNSEKTFTTATDGYISLRISAGNPTIQGVMLTAGSTAPTSYIPYGYKLPLTLGSTTTDIYLGEVQSTRRIKKLVLTGEEDWKKRTYGDANYTYEYAPGFITRTGLCSHYAGLSAQNIDKVDGIYLEQTAALIVTDLRFTTTTDFKAFLAAQYAAGTPVTVWRVLAEPETTVVNEPLMKIGDYVDSISGTNLATSGTVQELDIGTTLKPSELDLTYHGWHEHEDTKFTT